MNKQADRRNTRIRRHVRLPAGNDAVEWRGGCYICTLSRYK